MAREPEEEVRIWSFQTICEDELNNTLMALSQKETVPASIPCHDSADERSYEETIEALFDRKK
jgi:hypothetical protein